MVTPAPWPSEEDELLAMKSIRRILAQLHLSPRRAVVAWVQLRFETWPLMDRQGKMVLGADEHEKTDPPILKFISDHRPTEGDGVPDQATS